MCRICVTIPRNNGNDNKESVKAYLKIKSMKVVAYF